MSHPHDLLIDLVDDTLDAETRARVEAHLGSCETCRADLAFATVGRDAARSLQDEPAPATLHDRVVVAAGRASTTHPRWYRWVGAAAAAAVVVAIAVALPDVGSEPADETRESAATVAAAAQDAEAAPAGSVPLEKLVTDFDERGLRTLATDAADRATLAAAPASEGGSDANATRAIRCIEQSLGSPVHGKLVRLIEARFAGQPAYIAVYREGPGAGQGADIATVYVAAKDGCAFLSTAFAKI